MIPFSNLFLKISVINKFKKKSSNILKENDKERRLFDIIKEYLDFRKKKKTYQIK